MSEDKDDMARQVRFGHNWIAPEEAKKKRETVNEGIGQLKKMHDLFPRLATDYVREVLNRLAPGSSRAGSADAEAEAGLRGRVDQPDLEALVAEMSHTLVVDEIIETLAIEHNLELDAAALARLAGAEAYSSMLRRELQQYRQYFLSPEQVAELWNEAAISVPGGGLWNTAAVERLMKGPQKQSSEGPEAAATEADLDAQEGASQ